MMQPPRLAGVDSQTQGLSKALPELNLTDELTDVHNPADQLVGCPLYTTPQIVNSYSCSVFFSSN